MGIGMAQVLRSAFSEPMDELILRYVASVDEDAHLLACDIRGSLAHVAMLEKCGVVAPPQASSITAGLQQILAEGLELGVDDEDVHMAVERRLEQLIGADAKLLHTARSRNDQVALDLRLYVDDIQGRIRTALAALRDALVATAAKNARVVMPGYTHLQRAQPVLFAHVLLSFHDAIERDLHRFDIPLVSPLGAAALAGTAIPNDPAYTAKLLGAEAVFSNSIDAVSDRDFAAEFLFACALTATHLSQIAENLILWCTAEFGFVSLPDALTTGSSIMPQKKNPDCLELVRGRTGMFVGELTNLLVTLKALPFGYNRDLQETKPPIIRASQTLLRSINVCEIAISRLEVHDVAMEAAANDELLFATDLVERLVASGVAFREAHSRIAAIVKSGRKFCELTNEEWLHAGVAAHLASDLTPLGSVTSRASAGGTSPESVDRQLSTSYRR